MIKLDDNKIDLAYDDAVQIVGETASILHLVAKSVEDDKLLTAEQCLQAIVSSAILYMELDGIHVDFTKLAEGIVASTHVAPLASE